MAGKREDPPNVPVVGPLFQNIERPGSAFAEDLHAHAEWSIFEADAKGPNSGVEYSEEGGIRAFAKAELASASASAGGVKATVGLSADTGIDVKPGQIEAKVLGTGFSFGRKMGVSLFGSGFEFKLW